MAGITQAMCTSFKVDVLSAGHNFNTTNRAIAANTQDVFRMALYLVVNGASLDATTTAYTTVGEISGTGYTAGGLALTVSKVPSSGGTPTTTAFISFSNAVWPSNSSFSADGALIYNASNANKAVCVLNFGGTKVVSANSFTVVMPAAGTGSAIVQFS